MTENNIADIIDNILETTFKRNDIMYNFKSNLLKLSQATQGGKSGLLTNKELVKLVAKDQLRRTIHHTSWNAMYNSKAHLRKAALSGRYSDLPEWVRNRVYSLYFRIIQINRPIGLILY